jgi:uncharacterized membrane protein
LGWFGAIRIERDSSAAKGNSMTVTTSPAVSYNAAGAISYFTFIPAVVFLLIPPYKDSPCVRFHAWQSILLSMVAFAVDIVLGAIALLTLFLGTAALAYTLRLLFLFWLILWLACVIKAMNGKRLKLPVIGSIAEKLSMK